MDQDLISKKELLEATGISYGQLYRWKRKNLIPEEWFIRKSTFTGQETFFPRDRIMVRIDKIKNMKEDRSLDDLADLFSPNPAEVVLTGEQVRESGIVSGIALDLFLQHYGDVPVFSFEKILYLYVLEKMLATGLVILDEGKTLLQLLEDEYQTFEGKNCELFFLRKLGIATCLLVSAPSRISFEKGTMVAARLNLAGCIEELKAKISKRGM